MMRNEKLHKKIHKKYLSRYLKGNGQNKKAGCACPTIQEAIRMIECWQEYKNSQPCPHEVPQAPSKLSLSNSDKTNHRPQGRKSIAEVLATVKTHKLEEFKLDDLMMAQDIKTIGRNGIRFLKSDYYDDTLYGLREKVLIKYSLFDLSKIKVFSTKG